MTAYPLAADRYTPLFDEEARAFLDAYGRCSPDAAVAGCDGWSVATLGRHLGSIYERVEQIVRTGSREDIDRSKLAIPPDDADVPSYLEEGAERLGATLAAADPEAVVWAYGGLAPVSFWSRRMVHETMVHAFDLEEIAPPGHRPPEDALGDGIDEFLTAQLMRKLPRLHAAGLVGRLALSTDSGDRWVVALSPDAAHFCEPGEPGDTTLSGDAKGLLCYLWNRTGEDSITVSGDRELLSTYKEKVRL